MSEFFVNPYTFLPLEKETPERRKQDNSIEGTLSGYIDLSISVREGSPLFIPNTTKSFPDKDVPTHMHKVFYSYSDLSEKKVLTDELRWPKKPIIPGSELRGMVRNIYEQLTNSCYLVVDENNLPYKRTNEPKELCIMRWSEGKKQWLLYPDVKEEEQYYRGAIRQESAGFFLSDRTGWKDSEEYKTGFDRYEKHTCVKFDPKNGNLAPGEKGEYYLHIPPLMMGKNPNTLEPTANKCIVYTAKGLTDEKGIPVSEENLKRFENVLGITKDVKGGYLTDRNLNADSRRVYERYAGMYDRKEPLIVYADKNSVQNDLKNDVIYLAPACMTKEFFSNTVTELLKRNHEHQPCSDKNNLCPACRLFGMIGENGAAAGKLRFADSAPGEGIKYGVNGDGNETTLSILGTPKISSTEFYLRSPTGFPDDGMMWNYDYYVTYSKQKGETVFHRHPYTAVPEGRKVYWNRRFSGENAGKRIMNATVTPISAGTFRTRIRFDLISEEELEKLLFCLTPPGYVHKIGGGKPLGMGQVKLKVESTMIERYVTGADGVIRKDSRDYKDYKRNGELKKKIEELKKKIEESPAAKNILLYGKDIPDKELIDYPRLPDSPDIFKWFQKNRGSVSAPKIQKVLPEIGEEDQKLPSFPNNGKSGGGNRQGFNGGNRQGFNGGYRPNGNYQNNNKNKKW